MFAQDKKSTPQVILHFWNQGIRSPLEIHKKTDIPIRTIKYNVKKIKDTGSVARKQGSGRTKKITASASKAIGQYLRRDPTASSRKMVPKLAEKGLELSYQDIWEAWAIRIMCLWLPQCLPIIINEYELNGLMLTLMITGRKPFLP